MSASIRDNNFDFLRIAAALAVIAGHAFYLRGTPEIIPVIGGIRIHILGVAVFFAISGYLITKSRLGRNSPGRYLAHRTARIFPALIVVVALSVLALGPVFTGLSVTEYFANPGSWEYFKNAALHPVYRLPGVFGGLPYPAIVNGSLWTLPVEFFCYLVVFVIGFLPRRAVGYALVAFALLSMVGWLILVDSPERLVIWGTLVNDAARMWGFFAVGGILALIRRRAFFRLDAAAVLTLVWLLVPILDERFSTLISWVLVPYIVLSFGLASTPILRRTGRFGDFSYGLYLYAFPVQQVVVQVIGPLNAVLNLMLVTALTLVCAVASWHLVEKHALRLARRSRASGEARVVREPLLQGG
ncbi:acyltransferase [Herbiconiux sp. CPCC 203407]|uniref:Acyltransferase n=1 Tax=Herbiconiux oxytropis TaxID=2970915 RepID=A0AA41XH53_9MICO|nr:acyltransferase [Herbiconiux oxytropis]MCS5722015.1 acyltransferase [Herbiconiux oxytropis]MCS5725598.1 acyltransferase [Herbiconiux oxytropis]